MFSKNLIIKNNVLLCILVSIIAIVLTCFSCLKASATESNNQQDNTECYEPGQVIVCVESSTPNNPYQQNSLNSELGVYGLSIIEELATVDANVLGGLSNANVDNYSDSSINNLQENTSNLQSNTETKIILAQCDDVEGFCEYANNIEGIIWAQPNYKYSLDSYQKEIEDEEYLNYKNLNHNYLASDKDFNNVAEENTADTNAATLNDTNNTNASDTNNSIAADTNNSTTNYTYDDPYFKYQWGFDGTEVQTEYSIQADKTWSECEAPTDTNVVAVVDSGVDYTHPDISANMWSSGSSYPQLTSLGGGAYGLNSVPGETSTNPYDSDVGHGTHCVSAIAGVNNNATGTCGVSNNCSKIMACRAFSKTGALTSSIIKAYNYIVTAKKAGVNVNVISNSWGTNSDWGSYDYALESLICSAGQLGVVSVFSSGNDAIDVSGYPQRLHTNPYTITVGASSDSGKCCNFSNYSKENVQVFAPGTSMLAASSQGVNNSYLPWVQQDEQANYYYENFESQQSVISFLGLKNTSQTLYSPQVTYSDGCAEVEIQGSNYGSGTILIGIPKNQLPQILDSNPLYISGRYTLEDCEVVQNYTSLVYYDGTKQKYIYGYYFNANNESNNSFSVSPSSREFLKDSSDYAYVGLRFTIKNIGANAKLRIDDFGFGKATCPYCYNDGTSMACPVVSGCTAYVAAKAKPTDADGAKKVVSYILGGVKESDSLQDKCSTGGVVDLYNSYTGVTDEAALNPVINDVSVLTTEGQNVTAAVNGNFFGNTSGSVQVDSNDASVVSWSDNQIIVSFTCSSEHVCCFTVSRPDGKTGRGYYAINMDNMGYIDLPAPNNSYVDKNGNWFVTSDLDVLRSVSTDNYLYVLFGSEVSQITVMERYNYQNSTWEKFNLSDLNNFAECGHNGAYSLASAGDELYFLYPSGNTYTFDMRLATFSEDQNKFIYDVGLNGLAKAGDMICNVNGQLWLAGKDKAINYSRSSNIVAIFPDTGQQYLSIGNFNQSNWVSSGNMTYNDGKVIISDSRDYFCLDVTPNGSFVCNGPVVVDNGQITYFGNDLYNGIYGNQYIISSGFSTSIGVLELGMVKNNGQSSMVDNHLYNYSGTLSEITNARFASYKCKNIAASTRSNNVYAIAKNGLNDNMSFRYMPLSTIGATAEDVGVRADKWIDLKPEPVLSSATVNSLTISWQPVKYSEKYAVAIVNDDGTYNTLTTSCTNTNYQICNLNINTQYKILVQAYVTGKWSSFSAEDYLIASTCSLKPDFRVDQTGDGKVKVSWNAVPGASQYVAYEVINGQYVQIGTMMTSEILYIEKDNLANNFEHVFLVQAYASGKWSTFTSDDYKKITPTGTVKPTVSLDSKTDNSITLSWNHVPGVSTYAIASKVGQSKYTTYSYSCLQESFTINDLEDGVTYDCIVQANVNERWSAFDEGDLCTVTTNTNRPVLNAYASGDGVVTLSWNQVQNAQNYVVYELVDGKYKQIGDFLPSSILSIEASNLANNYEHTFFAQALVDGKWTKFAERNYAYATPTGTVKPSVQSSSATGYSIILAWNHVPGVSSYAVASRNSQGQYTTYTYSCNTESFCIEGLIADKEYSFLVQANINGRWSSFVESDHFQASTKKVKPSLSAQANGDGKVLLSWDSIENAQYYLAYEVINGAYKQIGDTLLSTTTSVQVENLANNYEHTFLVQAYAYDIWSSFTSDDFRKATPTGTIKPTISETSTVGTTINLSWNKVPGASSYAVATKTENSGFTTYTYDCKSTSFSITGLAEDTTYYCLVQACINGRWSAFETSDLKEVYVLSTRPQPTATPTGDGEVTLTWPAIENAEQYVAYEVVAEGYKQIGEFLPRSVTSVVANDLANYIEHTFFVQAKVAGTWSKFDSSNFVTATPTGKIKPTVAFISSTDTSITLSWDKIAGSTEYAVAVRDSFGKYHSVFVGKDIQQTTITNLIPNTAYKALVQCKINGVWSSFTEEDLIDVQTQPAQSSFGTYKNSFSKRSSLAYLIK